jgi:hypothetical protein
MNDKGDYGKIKLSGGRIEMKAHFNFLIDGEMQFELIQVNSYQCFGIWDHFLFWEIW